MIRLLCGSTIAGTRIAEAVGAAERDIDPVLRRHYDVDEAIQVEVAESQRIGPQPFESGARHTTRVGEGRKVALA